MTAPDVYPESEGGMNVTRVDKSNFLRLPVTTAGMA